MPTYLDYNASTPINQEVLDAMVEVYQNDYGNADSRTHDYGNNARKIVEKSRKSIAKLLSVNNDEIFFTSGATESDNISILGLMDYAEKVGKNHIISTTIEHKAVLEPLRFLKNHGFDITLVSPNKNGRINVEDVMKEVRNDTLLVSVMHANNETGIIQPVKEIGDYLKDKGILFHIDAAQSFGKLVDELRTINYDMLSASAHKVYGPQGIGILVLKRKKYKLPPIKSIMFGGSQEHGIRPGTLPVALIAGFGKVSELLNVSHSDNTKKYNKVKDILLDVLRTSGVKYDINGDQEYCIPNTMNVSFIGVNSEALMLATKQYCGVSNGSACNSSSYNPSYVLQSMGIPKDRISSSIRISWGIGNTLNLVENFNNMLDVVKQFQ